MTDDSEPAPSLSAAFHVGRSSESHQEAIQQLARHAERNVRVNKVHWREIARVEGNTQTNASEILKLTVRITRLETKVTLYAALGSFVGGVLVAVVMHFWK